MPYRVGLTTVITDEGGYIHESFDRSKTFSGGSEVKVNEDTLTATTNDFFGWSVSVGSGKIVVGCPGDDDNSPSSGSFSIYDINGNFISKISPNPGGGAGDSVSVGNGRIVIGAKTEVGLYNGQGAAYVYDLDGNFIFKLTDSFGFENDFYGTSVSVGCNRIVVGSPGDNEPTDNTGSLFIYDLDGNIINKVFISDASGLGTKVSIGCGRIVSLTSTNEVFIFDLDGNLIKEFLVPSQITSQLYTTLPSYSIDIGCGRIVLGVNCSYFDISGNILNFGAALLYDINGTYLGEVITNSPFFVQNEYFGSSIQNSAVSVSDGVIAIGARGASSNTGSVSIFDLDGNYIEKLTASDGASGDQYGSSVSVGCGRIVVGSYSDDIGAITNQGSAYIYKIAEDHNTYWERIIDNYKY
jgi:hypothetical protein